MGRRVSSLIAPLDQISRRRHDDDTHHGYVPVTAVRAKFGWRESDVMSYAVTLRCGCAVYVACHPRTGLAHTCIIERRAPGCTIRSHEVGVRLQLAEVSPDSTVSDSTDRLEVVAITPGRDRRL